MKVKTIAGIVLGTLASASVGAMVGRFYEGRRRAEQEISAASYPRLEGVGTVKRLNILPLIDWYTSRAELAGEAGVSYLIRADETTILFDLGYNPRGEHPSPLLRNMETLGVDLAEIDAIVISHAHEDHVGGVRQMMQHTFALSGQPVDLNGIHAYVPVPLMHPTARVRTMRKPKVLAPGVATMGPIPRQMFFLGWTLEQSLAINVEGKGIVLIIGCGHPTIQRIIERAEMLFEEPIYGVIGGLHYPVTASRETKFGLPLQRIFGTGKPPWAPINRKDVAANIAFLKRRDPQLVSLSAHDSCDWSIEAFRSAFADAYRDLRVGEAVPV